MSVVNPPAAHTTFCGVGVTAAEARDVTCAAASTKAKPTTAVTAVHHNTTRAPKRPMGREWSIATRVDEQTIELIELSCASCAAIAVDQALGLQALEALLHQPPSTDDHCALPGPTIFSLLKLESNNSHA
jgi:hypothetical protein